jgi:O-antigen/teichoic acid export membrane protein
VRLRLYIQGLTLGYVMLAVNTIYTLASVPLALHYLSKAEFGLWALTSQLSFYLNLLDFGMAGAATRILIDYKDDRQTTHYGGVILTGWVVNLLHAALILVVGTSTALILGPALGVPAELQRDFGWLMFWLCAGLAVSSMFRTAGAILMAHQRYDLLNLAQTLLFAVNFLVLWYCFALGQGVLSLAWAQGVGQVLVALVTVVACVRLGLLPASGRWGKPAWKWFWELFVYGRDMFFYTLGHLLINFSQTLLITKVAGLDTAAVWSICTRAFTLVSQFAYRLFDSSIPALGEMIVRGEKLHLLGRFKSMVVLSASTGVVAGAAFAVGNQGFTQWWTGGKIGWAQTNDGLLAVWLVLILLVRIHTGLVGLTKEFRFLRYLYFCEGLFFVTVGYVALRWQGITWMLVVSILATSLISLPYGTWRTAAYFSLPWRTVGWNWLQPTLRLAVLTLPMAVVIAYLGASLGPLTRLLVCSGAVSVLGGVFMLRYGLDSAMQAELVRRLPPRLALFRRWIETGDD